MGTGRRLYIAGIAVATVLLAGTIGYRLLGLSWLESLYQAVTTVTTVGFREVGTFGRAEMAFTIVLILAGVGTVLYALTAVIRVVLEGELLDLVGRRRMDRRIAGMADHVVLCGWGRVGRAIGRDLTRASRTVVVVERDSALLEACQFPAVEGDATDDDTLRSAGIERAAVLVAALASDADNLFVTLSGRAMQPSLFIVARARDESSVEKLARAGADRIVNPQEIGGARMAAYILQPNVAEFVDVVMHERSLEFRLGEVTVPAGSALVGSSLRELPGDARVLAVRRPDAPDELATNPDPATPVAEGDILVVVGTDDELRSLNDAAGGIDW